MCENVLVKCSLSNFPSLAAAATIKRKSRYANGGAKRDDDQLSMCKPCANTLRTHLHYGYVGGFTVHLTVLPTACVDTCVVCCRNTFVQDYILYICVCVCVCFETASGVPWKS